MNEVSKLHNVARDHKNWEEFQGVLNKERNARYLRPYKKELTITEIIDNNEIRNVVDINIDSDDRLFITSHGIISHNCALGGRGDVDQHENFEEILRYTRQAGIVPSFTSSGLGFTPEIVKTCKELVGAVAISWYRSDYTIKAINMLLDAGVKTNIHYVLGNNSIDEAIERLENNDFPKGINAVIFLLHKPVGLGQQNNVLKANDPKVKKFFELIDNGEFNFKIGFDSCTIPGLINNTHNINPDSFDSCEGGRYSMYITPDMKAIPCSFDNRELKWAYDISNDTIQNAWDSEIFEDFRNHFRNSCAGCKNKCSCYGGCPICRETVLCDREEKDLR